jgi:hypothetical protein
MSLGIPHECGGAGAVEHLDPLLAGAGEQYLLALDHGVLRKRSVALACCP